MNIVEISLKNLTDHPTIIAGKRVDTFSTCSNCDLFSGVIENNGEFLCKDCYEELSTPIWDYQHSVKQAELKKKRLAHAWEDECKKRRKKGLAIINLRR